MARPFFHFYQPLRIKKFMLSIQIDRLKKDSKKLSYYAERYKKQGKTERMYKILKKQKFLDDQIFEMQEAKTAS